MCRYPEFVCRYTLMCARCVDIVHAGLRGREDNLEPHHQERDDQGLRPVQLPRGEHRGGGIRPDYIRETNY